MHKWEYTEYLKTAHWQSVKGAALKRAKYKCSVCRSEVETHVHHLNYDNLWAEKPEDLIVLCECCHTLEHNRPEDIEPRALAIIQRMQRDMDRGEEFGLTHLPELVRAKYE